MDRRELLWKMTAQQFAAFDTQLYLDTHPDDVNALRMFNTYQKARMELRKQFESLYGPLGSDSVSDGSWKWVSDPWPWEREAN